MKILIRSKSEWLYLCVAIVLVAGFALWASDLSSDPPMYFSGVGQSLSTDPYMYSFHARNSILFGDAEPFDDYRWTVFKNSLVSLISYFWLSLTGVSLVEANTVGVLLSIAALFLVILGLLPYHRPWVILAVAVSYLLNVSLITYGRLPYLENGLLFFSGLIFLVWSRFGEKKWGQFILGLLVAAATLTGKIFGILLLPALIVSILFCFRHNRLRAISITFASFVSGLAIIVLTLYHGRVSDAISFFQVQSVGLHGFPEALTSPLTFVEQLVGFGSESNLFYLNPDLLLLLLVGCTLSAFIIVRRRSASAQVPPTTMFCLCWVGSIWIGLTIPNYVPLRYVLYLIPAIIILPYTLIDWLVSDKLRTAVNISVTRAAIVGLVVAITVFEVVSKGFYYNDFSTPTTMILLGSLFGGAAVAVSVYYSFQKRTVYISRHTLYVISILLLAMTVTVNGFRIRRKYIMDNHFTTIEASQDLAQITSPEAVIAGPFGPTLTFQTNRKSIIHFFNKNSSNADLLNRFPVTHLAVDQSNWNEAVKQYPQLNKLKPVASYWIRDILVQIYRTSELSKNEIARKYTLSPYEIALDAYNHNLADSAMLALAVTPDIVNSSKSAGILYTNLMQSRNQVRHVLTMLQSLADRYPTDFRLQLECGKYMQQLALARKDRSMLRQAEVYFQRAVKVNPYRAAYAARLFSENMRKSSSSKSP